MQKIIGSTAVQLGASILVFLLISSSYETRAILRRRISKMQESASTDKFIKLAGTYLFVLDVLLIGLMAVSALIIAVIFY
jgi:hypothetical protein